MKEVDPENTKAQEATTEMQQEIKVDRGAGGPLINDNLLAQ